MTASLGAKFLIYGAEAKIFGQKQHRQRLKTKLPKNICRKENHNVRTTK